MDNENICRLCGKSGADKIAHPVYLSQMVLT
jgi:hypothetical protein